MRIICDFDGVIARQDGAGMVPAALKRVDMPLARRAEA